MKLYIKNMVCIRCKMIVKSELEKLGINFSAVSLGEVEVPSEVPNDQMENLRAALKVFGLELMDDKIRVLVEKIKSIIIEMIHYIDYQNQSRLSDYMSEKLNHPYSYLNKLFLEAEGTSIKKYYQAQKIERVKDLLLYDGLTLSDIAIKLDYCSEFHLSKQFKKMTGMTPSQFRTLKNNIRNAFRDV